MYKIVMDPLKKVRVEVGGRVYLIQDGTVIPEDDPYVSLVKQVAEGAGATVERVGEKQKKKRKKEEEPSEA